MNIGKTNTLKILEHNSSGLILVDENGEKAFLPKIFASESSLIGDEMEVFVYQDDVRKIMWVFKVIAKKTNQLTQTDLIAVKSFVREMELEIKNYEMKMQQQKPQLKVLKGGKDG